MTYFGADSRDSDGPDVLEVGSERERSRQAPRWLVPTVLAVVIVAAGVAGIARLPGHHRVQSYPVVVTSIGRRLLGVRAGWEVFGRGPHSVVAISLAAGQITTTQVPELSSNSPEVAFIVGPHDAIIRSFDDAPGYVVPDGSAARPLTG